MVSSPKMTPWLMAFFCLATAGCSNVTDQQTSESQHDQQVAILKQIRKVNEDGSYTYGYEAGDGSFKVESRDVLGNIKGTFGFVDATGEIKRVSYSSSNGTGFKSTTVSPLQEQISVVQSIPRHNRTSPTTKKTPNVLYATSTESATKSSVVQSIPRTRKTTTTPGTSTSTASSTEGTTRASIARPKGRHRVIINGQQRPLVLEEEEIIDEDSQITRPSSTDKSSTLRRVVFTKRPLDHNLRPITEEFEDKEEEVKITTGNALRRQLKEETTKATTPVVESEDDHADVYGGALSTSRPLFTTSTPPRAITRASLRHERQKHIFTNQDNGPAKFDQSPRTYEAHETKNHVQEDRNTAQQVLIRTTTRAPGGDPREYVRPNGEPVYVRPQPDAYLRDVPQGGILVPADENTLEADPRYRSIPLNRLLLRPEFSRLLQTPQQPLYTGPGTTDANIHYLTDSPPAAQEQEEASPRVPINPAYLARQRAAYQRQLAYPEALQDPRRALLRPVPPVPQPVVPQDEREYQNVNPEYPYRMGQIALPPEPPNPIAPPLSRRDFQLLLRRLLVSQYGAHALNYPKTYLEDALYDQQPYPSYQPAYQAPIGRPEVPYGPEPVAPVAPPPPPPPPPPQAAYPERVPLRRPMYSRAINPLYQQNQYEDYPEAPRYPKRVYRQKFYTPEVADEGEEILPPHIREALLLRMLQLAINAERPIAMPNTLIMTTAAPPTTRYRKSGPVRSVQILGEDIEDEKEMRKKIMG